MKRRNQVGGTGRDQLAAILVGEEEAGSRSVGDDDPRYGSI
jgi:hypothetical protein